MRKNQDMKVIDFASCMLSELAKAVGSAAVIIVLAFIIIGIIASIGTVVFLELLRLFVST
jgi:hypothetical protein